MSNSCEVSNEASVDVAQTYERSQLRLVRSGFRFVERLDVGLVNLEMNGFDWMAQIRDLALEEEALGDLQRHDRLVEGREYLVNVPNVVLYIVREDN